MVKVQRGYGNVYADIGGVDAVDMLIKAQLANMIAPIIAGR